MDNLFGIHESALLLREKRTNLLANNIANAETPGYKARDIPFTDILKQEIGQADLSLAATDPNHFNLLAVQGKENLQYRTPSQYNLDGNTVDTQIEQTEFAQNSIHYMASLNFVNQRVHQILLALKGE